MTIDGVDLPYGPVECRVEALALRWSEELLVDPAEGARFQAWAEGQAPVELVFGLEGVRQVSGAPRAVRELLAWAGAWRGAAQLSHLQLLLHDGLPRFWRVSFEGVGPLCGVRADAAGEG